MVGQLSLFSMQAAPAPEIKPTVPVIIESKTADPRKILGDYKKSKDFKKSGIRSLHVWATKQSTQVMTEVLTNLQLRADTEVGPFQIVRTSLYKKPFFMNILNRELAKREATT